MRFLYLKINPEYQSLLAPFYNKMVIPELQKTEGCLFAGLVKSSESRSDYVSATLWRSRQQAEAYDNGPSYKKLMEQVRPYLAESTEWKVHLSDDLELQYDSVTEEPISRGYKVTAEQAPADTGMVDDRDLYVRLVSIIIQPGKLEEFRKIYMKEIVPALQNYRGCRYIYLSESMQEENEVVSITVWDSKIDAENYENSGKFGELVDKVKHTFSHFYQWKVELAKEHKGELKTSDDMKVDYYRMVSGKRFN
jgi:quinol monooxygenase YgiN